MPGMGEGDAMAGRAEKKQGWGGSLKWARKSRKAIYEGCHDTQWPR